MNLSMRDAQFLVLQPSMHSFFFFSKWLIKV
ncbi:hypothetical protein T07_6193 [Trichinella nelsoni]|uniref:Uncharacterized protein n=1 Tax=Trichinella nelsoni TaxID=6336 RepID=A0A0V0RBG9_9BILA|nr:hypothetical protein T07_6193 [Trichinella nelsoni]